MILRELTILDEDRFNKYIASWRDEKIVPSNNDPSRYESFEEMITVLTLDKIAKEDHWVPATTLFLFHDDEILGAINIRLELNEHLKNIGGHIGYGVNPPNRGHRYASYMVREALEYLHSMKVHDVLITCDDENVASKKTIISAGGIEAEDYVTESRITKRYWIDNRNYKDKF